MYDLMLTPNGDLAFETSEQLKDSLQINFITSKTRALSIDFHIENLLDKNTDTGFTIDFRIHKPLNNKTCREVIDQEYFEQCIRLRLETTIGTLEGNKDMGSRLELFKHDYVDSLSIENDLIKCVKEAIKDILPDALVSIKKKKTQYLNYTDSFIIVIVDQDKYYEYYL